MSGSPDESSRQESSDSSGEGVVWQAEDFWLDSHGGSGSLSPEGAWARENSRRPPNDGRSHTRTTFYPEDVSTHGPGQKHRDHGNKRSWGDLAKWNDGMYSDKSRGSQNCWADNQRWVDIVSDHVNATDYHVDRTKQVLSKIDRAPYQAAHIQMELLILAILSVFIDREIECRPDESPAEAMERRTVERDGAADLMETIGADRQDVVEARRLLLENDSDCL